MGEVRKLWIEGPAGRLEAAVRVARDPRATAVVAHPHPLHGGTLHNPVVFHVERALHDLGVTTLRFDFRGVGTSDGAHDDGRGEVGDVAAAAAWVRGLAPDAPLLVAGYSFGAWCAIRHAVDDTSVRGVIAVGLPVRHYDLAGPVARLGRPLAVVQGGADEFGSPDEVRAVLERAHPRGVLHVVESAPHLFPGRAREAAAAVEVVAAAMLDRLAG